jgi:hypothetical protein
MKRDRERARRAYSIIGLLIISAVIISMVASAVITTPAP